MLRLIAALGGVLGVVAGLVISGAHGRGHYAVVAFVVVSTLGALVGWLFARASALAPPTQGRSDAAGDQPLLKVLQRYKQERGFPYLQAKGVRDFAQLRALGQDEFEALVRDRGVGTISQQALFTLRLLAIAKGVGAGSAMDGADVRRLLEDGANPDVRDEHGFTPLMWAVRAGAQARELARLLLAHDANVDKQDTEFGVSALTVACSHGDTRVVRMLLKSGANINLQTKAANARAMCDEERQAAFAKVPVRVTSKALWCVCACMRGVCVCARAPEQALCSAPVHVLFVGACGWVGEWVGGRAGGCVCVWLPRFIPSHTPHRNLKTPICIYTCVRMYVFIRMCMCIK